MKKLRLSVGDKVSGHRVVHLGRDHRPPPPPKEKPEDDRTYEDLYIAAQLGLYGPVSEIMARKGWRR